MSDNKSRFRNNPWTGSIAHLLVSPAAAEAGVLKSSSLPHGRPVWVGGQFKVSSRGAKKGGGGCPVPSYGESQRIGCLARQSITVAHARPLQLMDSSPAHGDMSQQLTAWHLSEEHTITSQVPGPVSLLGNIIPCSLRGLPNARLQKKGKRDYSHRG